MRNWTETDAELTYLGKLADAIEVAGCVQFDDCVERVDNKDAQFYSVYFHYTPEWPGDPTGLAGAMCIADRNTLYEAKSFAQELANHFELPINICI
ncbi:hypothetical protein [Altericroceibacterium spongiae]|nr:hypothetical protein [Altericroceibacterium spongiae]